MLKKESAETASTQQTLTHLVQPKKKYDTKHPKQLMVTDALVDFVAEDLMPLHLIDSLRFQKLLKSLDPQYCLPSRKHLSTTLLTKKYDQLKVQIKNRLKNVKVVNLTIDLWSNRQMRSYLGITAHYITAEWKLEHIMLGCNRVHGRHTAENIVCWFEGVISDFNITEQVKHIVTDSASNMKKAFVTLPGYEEDKDEDSQSSETEDDEDGEPVSLSLEDFSFEHHACFAHVLQLVIKDGMKKAGQIHSVLKRCSKLVAFVRKSTIATDILEGEMRLQIDHATRWNSQLKMVRSVLSIPEFKLSLLEGAPSISAHDRNILKDMIDILGPFEEATDFVQVNCVPSAGYVLPCVKGLQHHLDRCASKYHSSFVAALKASLQIRVPHFEENETYILAAMLDPRFKLRWCKSDSNKIRYKEILKNEAKKHTDTSETVADTGLEPPSKKMKTLFNFMGDPETNNENSSNEDVDKYLAASCLPLKIDPAKYWNENKNEYLSLAQIAKEVLSVPSSSAPVERLFSIAGKVFTPIRCRLTDSRFQQLMFIRCNNSLSA